MFIVFREPVVSIISKCGNKAARSLLKLSFVLEVAKTSEPGLKKQDRTTTSGTSSQVRKGFPFMEEVLHVEILTRGLQLLCMLNR